MALDPIKTHANAIVALPLETLVVVLDALRVRAMDRVHDALRDASDGDADNAADIVRALVKDADDIEPPIFGPDSYDFDLSRRLAGEVSVSKRESSS